ncbi:MAG: hypothetical protein U0457_09130 [Candidatus Sericytochromatia bacterium]
MKKNLKTILILSSITLFSCSNSNMGNNTNDTAKSPSPVASSEIKNNTTTINLNVKSEIERYTESMSSAFGIDLTPTFENLKTDEVIFRWETQYGTFLAQDKESRRITSFGKSVDYSENKIFWSPLSSNEKEFFEKKPDNLIKLSIIDKKTNKVLEQKTIYIEWLDKIFLRMKKDSISYLPKTESSTTIKKDFNLKIGEKAVLDDIKAEINLTELVSDSRCPINAKCIWAGEVNFKLSYKQDNKTEDFNLVSSAGMSDKAEKKFDNLTIKLLKVSPENIGTTDNPPKKEDYNINISVEYKKL